MFFIRIIKKEPPLLTPTQIKVRESAQIQSGDSQYEHPRSFVASSRIPFEGILEDVLEDDFGLLPRPQICGHDRSGAASHPSGDPKNRDEDGVCVCVLKRVLWIGFLFAGKFSFGVCSPSPKAGSPKNDKKP